MKVISLSSLSVFDLKNQELNLACRKENMDYQDIICLNIAEE